MLGVYHQMDGYTGKCAYSECNENPDAPFYTHHNETCAAHKSCINKTLIAVERTFQCGFCSQPVDPSAVQDRIQYASEQLRNDREVILAAVRHNGYAPQYVRRNDLMADRGVFLAVLNLRDTSSNT